MVIGNENLSFFLPDEDDKILTAAGDVCEMAT